MENQYTYYTPEQDENNQNAGGPDLKEPRKKNKKGAPKWVKAACLGLVFGLVASAAFQTSNIVAGKIIGTSDSAKKAKQTATVDSTKLTTSADSKVSSDIADIAKNAMPSVVSITNMSVQQVQNFFGGVQEQKSESVGSGIIIGQNDTELLIVTNNHVVAGNDTLTVSFIDEESVEANVKGTNAAKDLAVVAVKLSDIKDSTMDAIAVATLGDSTQIQVGEPAIAIGNALGYGQSVTNGIVSAKDREIEMEGFDSKLIQTNAAINPGNSGGALLNSRGEVIGINTVKVNDSAVEGMGYAIPISDVTDIITNLMNKETRTQVPETRRGYIGIEGTNVDSQSSEQFGMPEGVYVSRVMKGGGAAEAGITKGCVITGIEGSGVNNMESLQEQLSYYRIGEKVTLTVQFPQGQGEYKEKDVEVTLTKQLS